MKLNSTFNRMYVFQCILILFLPILLTEPAKAQSVRVYTETISSQSNTDNATNATDENLTTRARVRASSGLALGIGAYSGHIELQYDALLPANTTSYVKIETDDNLLPALLGGSLGGVLSDVLGGVLIGNQEFTVQARNNGTVVLQGDSQDAGEFATNRLRIVTDENGDYFIAITPAQAYNRIRLTNRLGSLLGFFNTRNLDVYDAFYISDADDCGQPSYTSFSGSGITLDLINLAGAGVDNPQNAIDDNTANFSQLSLGILGVAASIEQTVYFDGLSDANDQFNIRLRLNPSLVEVGVANNIQIIAQNGPNTVQTMTMGSLLSPELLGLLQSNQVVTIPFQTSSPASRITVRFNALLNVQLNQSLDLYGITRVPRAPVITDPFTLDPKICAGSAASLIATTASGYELHWFSAAQGGSTLATTQSGQPFVTPVLMADTSYYVAAVKIGCPEESSRVRINVDVVPLPTAADIEISSPLSACQGNITLTPTTSLENAVIRYYTNQNMTQEITTGYSGDAGVTYVKNNTTGALTISGLSAANSPYEYYIALQVDGLCTNATGTLKEVVVNYSSQLVVQAQANLEGCGSVNLADAIQNFDPNNTYLFFDGSNNPITAEATANTTTSGTYSIQAQGPNGTCASALASVNVTVNQQPTITATGNAIVTNVGNSVTLNATSSSGTIIWYNQNGDALASNTTAAFTSTGVYTFTGIATVGSCSASIVITVTVLDANECPPLTQPDFATMQSSGSIITGGVSNGNNAVDANLQTHSTVTTGIGLLGIGTTWQTLQWEETIPAGTPVTVKLGSEYSGLALIGGFSVVGTKRNGSGTPTPIGNAQQVSGSLLNLLPGENTFEYTFVPSNGSGPQDFDGVRVIIASTVSLAQNAKVFDAYYTTSATQVACGDDARDVLYGAVDLGVGALTATVGVDDAFEAIDNSQTSSATMYSGLGVLAAAEMTVVFNTPSIEGDQVRIRISKPGSLLSLSLLGGLSIQPMLGNAVSGSNITTSLLSLQLLGGGESAIVTFTPDATFDRLRIRYGGVAGVLEFLNVHDVERLANTHVIGADPTNTITACQGETITLEAAPIACTTFIWYDAEVGGNVVATGNSFTIPSDLPAGPHTFWIQPIRFGCAFLSRGSVTVNVTETAPENGIQSVTINGGAESSFCAPDGNVTLIATLAAVITITDPIFYWYSFDGTTQTLIAGETSSTLQLTGLAPGSYTYFVGFSSNEYCQTAEADRTRIDFMILPSSVAADISVADTGICLDGTAVITPTSTLSNPVFTYYFTNDTTQPILDGMTVGSVTFDIAPNGILTITGLDESNSPYTYYIALTSGTTCINQAGNLEAVTVTVGSLPTPTTLQTTQNFCTANNPTVADLQVNETGVLFYDAPTAGNLLSTTTPLVDGEIYYATLSDGVCESETRLAITVTIGNPATPTTNDNTQTFCAVNNPTVADIQVNETGVVFYNLPIAGIPYDPTTPLTNGIYYAAIVDGLCESEDRLAITVTISDPATPTTDDASQDFCAGLNPTVADLDVNESNIAVYDVASGGTALSANTPLVTGTYYATLVEAGTGCESSVRLEIAVNVNNVGTPTTNDATQDFCLVDMPAVSDIQVNETGVIFYDAADGGNAYDPSTPLVSGMYYAALVLGLCESDTRLEIVVNVADPASPTTDDMTQTFCLSDNPTVGDIQINEANIVVYGIMNGTPLDPSTPLTAGVYYMANVENGCESSIRLEITVIIDDPGIPTTNDATQNFCAANNPTVGDIQVNETGVVFFDAPTGGNQFSASTPLTAGTYYAAFGNVDCENAPRLEIAVTIGNPATPTTNDATQNFCSIDAPTVADIQVNETGVIFYTTPNGGTPLAASAPLTNGTYYAALSDGSCESAIRLEIAVTIGNPATPTTNDASQEFCLADNPTVAEIQVNGTGVIFYSAATGGTPLAATTPLTNGTYYVAASDGTCESAVRLEIAVTISNPATPTTNDDSQIFCLANNPTVADLEVNEANVVFYTQLTGGTPLSASTALVTGTYYAALVEGNCESSVRLEIDVMVSGSDTAQITGGDGESCISETVTYSTTAGMLNYQWNVVGGTIVSGGTATDNTANISWATIGVGVVSVVFTDANCGNTASASLNVNIAVCSDLTITKVVDNFNPNIGDEVTFTITVNNEGISNFTNVIINETLPSGYTLVSFHTSEGVYVPATGLWTIPSLLGNNSATLTVTAIVNPTGNYMNSVTIDDSVPDDSTVLNNGAEAWVEPICLIVYNEFTPNGDGDNETFRIDCIENYPNNMLQVFNRYGVMVYKMRSYQNNWDGIANQNSPINEDKMLPAGTYYYTLELNDGSGVTKSGWMYILR
ncbi:gliding motility-associated C-terminal domain-containing protein [Flavobacterium sp. MAH-1]|uniref:Gliding motility-associated C-terminal domain-containing protein n=1 Tax=Flavobacterium agri TaxID=2743471 RepID=A0A7Y8XZD7_9FLAO|nr:gliding motility-associated C-terminal domain-containing protein [Flavobacterium agri]NUY79522.1 gliding motility-associated C-terminal domain-containing protein [Flavobacterium agri]NYA69547.1 gliding motility-associated C-terminal domain-containing protein [Flavobacterium agri]